MKRRRPSPLMLILSAAAFASLCLMAVGASRLSEVENALDTGVAAVKAAITSDETAIVSFVPGGGGGHSVSRPTGRQTEGVGILIFHSAADQEVAVFDGTDPATLEKGAGRTVSTARLNSPGRCVLHGHRDSAFKPLRTIEIGDALTVASPGESVRYRVVDIFITRPEDPRIYDTVEQRQLLMVTCYPFTFVGPAPDRCVVVAEEALS